MEKLAVILHNKKAVPYVASAVLHLFVFGLLTYSPDFGSDKSFSPKFINVDLVSFSPPAQANVPPGASASDKAEPPAPKPEQKKPEPKEEAKPEPKPEPEVKKPAPDEDVVSIAPKNKKKETNKQEVVKKDDPPAQPVEWKNKESLKKKTFKSEKVVEKAINDLEKKYENNRPKLVSDAINRLKDKVGKEEAQGKTGGIAGIAGISGGGMGKDALEQIDIYKLEIIYRIQKNWAFSDQLGGSDPSLEVKLGIQITQNGDIEDIWFDRRSGNVYLDDSAYKAISKSNPLPPLPQSYRRPYFKVGLRFTPKGLN